MGPMEPGSLSAAATDSMYDINSNPYVGITVWAYACQTAYLNGFSEVAP